MKIETFTDEIEKVVLSALDAHMNKRIHGNENPAPYMVADVEIRPQSAGWRDEDLRVLLPAVRKHAHALFERYPLE